MASIDLNSLGLTAEQISSVKAWGNEIVSERASELKKKHDEEMANVKSSLDVVDEEKKKSLKELEKLKKELENSQVNLKDVSSIVNEYKSLKTEKEKNEYKNIFKELGGRDDSFEEAYSLALAGKKTDEDFDVKKSFKGVLEKFKTLKVADESVGDRVGVVTKPAGTEKPANAIDQLFRDTILKDKK